MCQQGPKWGTPTDGLTCRCLLVNWESYLSHLSCGKMKRTGLVLHKNASSLNKSIGKAWPRSGAGLKGQPITCMALISGKWCGWGKKRAYERNQVWFTNQFRWLLPVSSKMKQLLDSVQAQRMPAELLTSTVCGLQWAPGLQHTLTPVNFLQPSLKTNSPFHITAVTPRSVFLNRGCHLFKIAP